MREEEKRYSRQAGSIQSDSFIEWCLFLQEKTGNRQGWSKKYRDKWNRLIEEFSVEVMIGYVMEREFYNAEYAIACLEDLKDREDRAIMEVIAREKYWASKKKGWNREFEQYAERMAINDGTDGAIT